MNNQEGYVAWDIEIAKEIPEGVNWKEITPLGISCASIQVGETTGYRTPALAMYHGASFHIPLKGGMNLVEVSKVAWCLEAMDYPVLTWNGLQFDFAVLAYESMEDELCKHLAMSHIDMMFQLFCILGYPVGLDAVAKGLGLPGKPEDMSGALAPQLWAGSLEDRYKVLEYVKQDAVTTLDVCLKVQELGYVAWTSKAGRPMKVQIDKWLTVEECLQIPEPDTSWMTKPMSRKSFMEWMNPS